MKSKTGTWIYLFVIIGSFLMFSGCSKKSDDSGNNEITPPPVAITDIDGNVYQSVSIGTQVWMTENLKVTHYRNGEPIVYDTNAGYWGNLTGGAYCWYFNDILNKNDLGSIYNWIAVADDRKIAPLGWHIPNDTEVNTLIMYLGGPDIAGEKLKEAGNLHWRYSNVVGTNSSGFNALPGGAVIANLLYPFYGLYSSAWFWSSSSQYSYSGSAWSLVYDRSDVSRGETNRTCGCSVRCIKD